MRLVAPCAVALVVSASLGAGVLADDVPANSAAMSRGWEFSEQGGANLFQNVCAGCHQPDAQGAVGAGAYPSLVADEELASADFMMSVLLAGLRAMPPVGGMMSDAQVADVINYVRTHFDNSYTDAVSAADVSAARRRLPAEP
jgi:mono/diheme cytochrome c family protein